jgi:hypothetical protein
VNLAAPQFGDTVENGWASEDNPTRVGLFVREGRRTGRLNRGRYWEITDGNGKFWELSPTGDHKIAVRTKYVPPIADRATPKGVARLVEIARAFHADPNDMALRTAFMRATFNHDRHAAMIVALADEAAA